MQNLRISLVQSNLKWEDKTYNLSHLETMMNQIEEATDIIVLPEMFTTAFSMKPELFAEEIGGASLVWMQAQASRRNAALVGSFMVQQDNKFYNRLYFVEPNGKYQYYDKRHLFRMGNEQQHFSAGQKPLIIEYKGWRIQHLVCYDLRFPIWSKNKYQEGKYNYDLTLLVANWPAVRSYVWKTLLSARAIENQAYYVGVNRIGEDGNGLQHSGDSNIYDAKGIALLESPTSEEFVKTITISKKELNDFRTKFTVGLDWDSAHIDS